MTGESTVNIVHNSPEPPPQLNPNLFRRLVDWDAVLKAVLTGPPGQWTRVDFSGAQTASKQIRRIDARLQANAKVFPDRVLKYGSRSWKTRPEDAPADGVLSSVYIVWEPKQ